MNKKCIKEDCLYFANYTDKMYPCCECIDMTALGTVYTHFNPKSRVPTLVGKETNSKDAIDVNKMGQKEFDEFMEFIIEKHVKNVMCNKSAEYAQGGDKLHNFRRAARMHDTTPIEALRGMKLKHDCSIEDMLDGLREGKTYSQELWQEKLHDQINYIFLMWALLYKDNGWELK
ncbi:MAG: hypothetical protein PVI43_00765 [Candidatus Bathyarchaeota archaeon]|jgi:hypothetical protein